MSASHYNPVRLTDPALITQMEAVVKLCVKLQCVKPYLFTQSSFDLRVDLRVCSLEIRG